MEQDARSIFLRADLDEIIKTWELDSDEKFVYAEFFSQRLRIDKSTAVISLAPDDGWPCKDIKPYVPEDTYNETMVLFDMLSRTGKRPCASGEWASVSVLGGIIGAGHDQRLRNEPEAAKFAGQLERLKKACEALGGRPESKADAGYSIPVFKDLRILFQFWDADDEFPAGIKYLFDGNALQYMHYETLWYLMNACYSRVAHCFYNIDLAKSSR